MPISTLIPVRVIDENGDEVEISNYDFADDESGDDFNWPEEVVVLVRTKPDEAVARVLVVEVLDARRERVVTSSPRRGDDPL